MATMQRKTTVSITLMPDTVREIEAMGRGNSFSAKIEWIAQQFKRYAEQLVVYETDMQRDDGAPRVLTVNAQRLFSIAGFGSGVCPDCTYADAMDIALPASKGKKKDGPWVDEMAQKLRSRGYLVQVVREPAIGLLDVWVEKRTTDVGCQYCSKLNDAINIMKRELFESNKE